MSSALNRSIYEKILLESSDGKRTVDIKSGTVSIDYYEDIFSPTITLKIRVADGGDTIAPANGKSSEKQSLYAGLPLRGGERLALKISGNTSNNPGLDFSKNTKDYLYVSSISDVAIESQRETFVLNLVSREALTNETARVYQKYKKSPINEHVSSILKNILKTSKIGTIEKSSTPYSFIGNLKKPFSVLVWLASKAVPAMSKDASAGFVFYQTKEGFQFRSIDSLCDQEPIAKYIYTDVNKSEIERNNDFTILSYSIDRNQNLLEKLRLGTYSSVRYYFDPLTFKFTNPEEGKYKLDQYQKKVKNLGLNQVEIPNVPTNNNKSLGEIPSRIFTGVLDTGVLQVGVSTSKTEEPLKYQSQIIMRYNLLFTQTVSMIVPSNTNLKAGDVIECKFPKVSRSNSDEYDPDQSGLYMIKELCHHFDDSGSYTSMRLVRDTFGKK